MKENFYSSRDPTYANLISAYIDRYANMYSSVNGLIEKIDTNFWAYEEMQRLVVHNPKKALSLIIHILELTDNEYVLSNLAAGPLEDLLRFHGQFISQEIAILAENNDRFHELLNQVDETLLERHFKI